MYILECIIFIRGKIDFNVEMDVVDRTAKNRAKESRITEKIRCMRLGKLFDRVPNPKNIRR